MNVDELNEQLSRPEDFLSSTKLAQGWLERTLQVYPDIDLEQVPVPAWYVKPPKPAKKTAPEWGPDEQQAREYLARYSGTFAFLVELRKKFVDEHPDWQMSVKQVDAVLRCKARDAERSSTPGGKGTPGPTDHGIYRTPDGVVYKVQRAVHGSGRLYAKRLDRTGFVFDKGAIFKLDDTMKLDLAAAKEYGRLYGVCVNCGAVLTDENSIAEGIGPICATKEWF